MSAGLDALERQLGHVFHDRSLLDRALTHTSLIGQNRGDSYERLEFLGDRVLGLAVADLLYQTFSKEEEGALAKRYTALVRAEALTRVARDLDLGSHIRLAQSEEDTGGRDNPSILADVCEAVIAALYLDGGLSVAEDFVCTHWKVLMAEDLRPPKDAKTALQEWAQGRGLALPAYEEVSREGPPHAPVFEVSVSVSGLPSETAVGSSKRVAEQTAAEKMLARLAQESE